MIVAHNHKQEMIKHDPHLGPFKAQKVTFTNPKVGYKPTVTAASLSFLNFRARLGGCWVSGKIRQEMDLLEIKYAEQLFFLKKNVWREVLRTRFINQFAVRFGNDFTLHPQPSVFR